MKKLFYFAVLFFALLFVAQAVCQPNPHKNVKTFKGLEYARHGDLSMQLDLYVPEEGKGPFPLVVWVHGGGWMGGDRSDCPTLNLGYCQKGYATASVSYRFSQVAPFPAQIEDVKAAIRWLKAHADEYRLDPNRIGVIGASAGGHLVNMVGVTGTSKKFDVGDNLDRTAEVQAVCNIFGPTDFLHYFEYLPENTPLTAELHKMLDSLLGGSLAEKRDLAEQAGPVTHVDEQAPPFLHIHGTSDLLVPFQQAEFLHDKLRKHGVFSRLFLVPRAGHGDGGLFSKAIFQEIEAFFDEHLKEKQGSSRNPSAEGSTN